MGAPPVLLTELELSPGKGLENNSNVESNRSKLKRDLSRTYEEQDVGGRHCVSILSNICSIFFSGGGIVSCETDTMMPTLSELQIVIT
jgi:hypothetical protein